MSLIDFILNLAGLLLWFNWWSARFDPLAKSPPVTLAGTLKRSEPTRLKRWHFLMALLGLLCFRGYLYRQLGLEVGWIAELDLGAITLFFRSGQPGKPELMLFYSALSFVRTLVLFYVWLLAVVFVNRNVREPDPLLKLIRLQLGKIAGWPRAGLCLLPLVLLTLLWMALHPLLTRAGITNPMVSRESLLLQGTLIGLGAYLSLKFLIPLLLFLHLVASYVYFGSGPFWDFLNITARNILAPLQRLPLRFGKLDLAPLIGIILTLLLLQGLPALILAELKRRHVNPWPP